MKAVYAFGYADKGAYEPIPFVGEWWGDDFMPAASTSYHTTVIGPERQWIYRQRQKAKDPEKFKARHRKNSRRYYLRKKRERLLKEVGEKVC